MNLFDRPKTVLAVVAIIGAFIGGDLGRAVIAFVNAMAGGAY